MPTSNYRHYALEEQIFRPVEIPAGAARVDLHVHSEDSDIYVQTPFTAFIGVRESYTPIEVLYQTLHAKGMTHKTTTDHDVIEKGLEMRRRHPEDTFVSCEYTVYLNKRRSNQIIHIPAWGLDYAGNSTNPEPDYVVKKLHEALLAYANESLDKFQDFLETVVNQRYAFAHLAYQCNQREPIDGIQLRDLEQRFKKIEVNGDCQFENPFAVEIAMADPSKTLIAGSDAHTEIRLGDQYTSTLETAVSTQDFLQALDRGDVAIGSNHDLTGVVEGYPTVEEVIRHQFNGTSEDLRKDIFKNTRNYGKKGWNPIKFWRKYMTLATVGASPYLIALVGGPFWGALPVLVGAGIVLTAPYAEARKERRKSKANTMKLHKDYQQVLASERTEELYAKLGPVWDEIKQIEDNFVDNHERFKQMKLMTPETKFEKIALSVFGMINFFEGNYDGSKNAPFKSVPALEQVVVPEKDKDKKSNAAS